MRRMRTCTLVYYERRGRRGWPCPKSAILRSPLTPMSRFSGLMSRWITCFWWQYINARARLPMYVADFFSLNVCETRRNKREKKRQSQPVQTCRQLESGSAIQFQGLVRQWGQPQPPSSNRWRRSWDEWGLSQPGSTGVNQPIMSGWTARHSPGRQPARSSGFTTQYVRERFGFSVFAVCCGSFHFVNGVLCSCSSTRPPGVAPYSSADPCTAPRARRTPGSDTRVSARCRGGAERGRGVRGNAHSD